MTAATIRASAAYRKRQAAKLARYEAALREIAMYPGAALLTSGVPAIRDIARAALQEPGV